MAIEITRSPLKIDQVIGVERSQILVESDIIVPENKPDIGKILDVTGKVSINSKEVIQDKVMVEGAVKYNILYLAEDDDRQISSMEMDTSFTNYLDLPGAQPKMTAKISVELEHIDCHVVNSRKLSARSVMDVRAKVFDLVQLDIVDGFARDGQVEALRESITLSYEGGQGDAQTIIRESLELSDNMPTIVEILRKDIKIRDLEGKTADNKVVVNGIMDIGFLYLCEDPDYPIHYFDEQIEFAHVVDIAGVYQNMDCTCDVRIEDLYLAPIQDLNGDLRLVEVEALMFVEASVIERQYREILIDAYMPDGALDVAIENISLAEEVGAGQSQATTKELIVLPENMPKCDAVLYMDVEAGITDEQLYEGKAILEGVLSVNILYQSKESGGGIASFKQEIPFSQDVEIDGVYAGMDCESSIQVDRASFSLVTSDEIEIKVTTAAQAKVFKDVEINVIIGLEEKELPSKQQSGIFVYFIKPGDNLWSIAKRYNTTIENILKFNDLPDDGGLEVGGRIIVYKKYDYKREEMTM